MTKEQALKIVLELAQEAVDEACKDDSGMDNWKIKQIEAIKTIYASFDLSER